MQDYVRRSSYPVQGFTFSQRLELDTEMQSAPMADAEVDGYLGDLLLHINRIDDAELRLQQSLAANPHSGMAHASLGMLRVRQGRFADAKQHLERAVVANSRNYLAHYYYYAYALSREGLSEGQPVMSYAAESTQKMRAQLRKAIELGPEFLESYRLLAFVNLVVGENLDESIGLLKRALALSPGRHDFAFVLAQIYLRKQNYAAARPMLTSLAEASGAEPQLRAQAQAVLGTVAAGEQHMARSQAGEQNPGSRGEGVSPAGTPPEEETKTKDSETKDIASAAERPTLRRRSNGEQVRGLLTGIECGPQGQQQSVTLVVKAGDRLLKFYAAAIDRITFTSYVAGVGNEISCGDGQRRPANTVLVTYRRAKGSNSQVDGEVVAVELIPSDFDTKQQQ